MDARWSKTSSGQTRDELIDKSAWRY